MKNISGMSQMSFTMVRKNVAIQLFESWVFAGASHLSPWPEAGAGASDYSDCRSASGNCVCTAGLFADAFFVASTYGEGNVNIAAQYMVNL